MRARRVGTGSEFRLFKDEQEIGYANDTMVGFVGFTTRDDAALAAWAANSALARRRGADGPPAVPSSDVFVMEGSTQALISRAGVLATLLPPAPEGPETAGWGFEIALLPSERVEVFAIARARVIWRALRSTGIYRRMRQFGAERLASI